MPQPNFVRPKSKIKHAYRPWRRERSFYGGEQKGIRIKNGTMDAPFDRKLLKTKIKGTVRNLGGRNIRGVMKQGTEPMYEKGREGGGERWLGGGGSKKKNKGGSRTA